MPIYIYIYEPYRMHFSYLQECQHARKVHKDILKICWWFWAMTNWSRQYLSPIATPANEKPYLDSSYYLFSLKLLLFCSFLLYVSLMDPAKTPLIWPSQYEIVIFISVTDVLYCYNYGQYRIGLVLISVQYIEALAFHLILRLDRIDEAVYMFCGIDSVQCVSGTLFSSQALVQSPSI